MSDRHYAVTATRTHGMWELDIPGVGVTQAERASGVEAMVRDYLDCLGVPEADTARVDIAWHLDRDLDARVQTARQATREAAQRQAEAAEATREAVARLKTAGLTGRDIAAVLGVSEQRVSQLGKAA